MNENQTFGIFIQLEAEARSAETLDALFFSMVNGTRRLVECRQALVVELEGGRRPAVRCGSNIATIDRRAPFVQWFERILAWARRNLDLSGQRLLEAADFPQAESGNWTEWCPARALWIPFAEPAGTPFGGLWLARDEAWTEAEQTLLERLGDCYGHAWRALRRGRGRKRVSSWQRRALAFLILAAAAAGSTVPVRQSVLAPAEVVAAHPLIAAAPMDGTVAEVLVQPNQTVVAGDPLFVLDDTAVKAGTAMAQAEVELARAEFDKARQSAFQHAAAKAEIEVLAERLRLRETQLEYTLTQQERVVVRAEGDGVAVFTGKHDWTGRPVRTGEWVMTIAAPSDAALRIYLSAADFIDLPGNAAITLFLGVDPLTPIRARLKHTGYAALAQPDGTIAYELDARFLDEPHPRLGLRGTAKIYGNEVPLYMHLFRRPIAALRQFTGI